MMNPQGNLITLVFTRSVSLALAIVIASVPVLAQRTVESGDRTSKDIITTQKSDLPTFAPSPVFFSGAQNITCEDVRTSGNPAFAHMTTDWEFKRDSPTMGPQSYPLDMFVGPDNLQMSVSFDRTSSTAIGSWSLSWTSPATLDRLVSAVIIKGGNAGKNVYPYITPGESNAISHVSFCFEPFTAPTAADGTISGRTMKMDGTGIYNARIEVLNLSTGEIRQAISNPFGYYKLEGIETNDLYMVTVSHRRYQFANPQRTISFDGDLVDVDFVAF
jgi:hypothetical protein